MMIAVVVLLAGVAMTTSASDPLGCSLHGQAHVLMTDGHTRHQLTGSGLADIFSTSGLDVQCDINQTSSAQSTISSCRFLISSTTSPCSVDIVHGDQPGHVSVWGQVLPVTALEEFVSANVDPALGLTCHAVDDDTITIEITQRDAERFILIESSLNSFTITTSNVTSCSGACGTCQGPQTAPRPDTFAVMPFRAIQHQRRCGPSSNSTPAVVAQLPQSLPYSDAASATPIAAFTSPDARDSIIADCSGHDSARLQADSLFAGFVEACADDIASGSSPAIAKANMDSFVKVIENRQKVELAADALQRNPATVVCAACMSVEWDHPINTTSVLDTAKMLNAATGSQRAKHRSMYKKPAGHNLYVKKTGAPQELSFPASDLTTAPSSAPSSTMAPSTTQPSSSNNPTSSPASSSIPSSYAPTSSPASSSLPSSYAPTSSPASSSVPSSYAPTSSPSSSGAAPSSSSSQPTSSPFNTDSAPKYSPMPSTSGPAGSSHNKPLYEHHFKPVTDVSEGISFPAPSTTAPTTGYEAPIQITSAPSSAPTTAPGYDNLPATQQPMTSAPYTSQPTTVPGRSALPSKHKPHSMPTSSPSGNDTAPVTVMPTTAAPTTMPTSSPVPSPLPSVGNSTAPQSTTSAPTSAPTNSSSAMPATTSPSSNYSSAMPATTSPSNSAMPATTSPSSSAMPATTSPSSSAMPATTSSSNSSSAMPSTTSPTGNNSMPQSSTSSPTTSPAGGAAPSTSSPSSVPSPAPTSDFTAAAQSSSSPTSSPSSINGSVAPATTMPSPTSSASMAAFTSSPNASTTVPTSGPGNQSLGLSQLTTSPIGSQQPITTSPSNLTAPVLTPAPSSSNVAAATPSPSSNNMSNPSTTSPGSTMPPTTSPLQIVGFNVTSGLPIFSSVPTPIPSVPTPIPSVNLSATPVPTSNGSSALPATKQPEKANATRPPITLTPVDISSLLPTISPNGTVRPVTSTVAPLTTVPVVMSTVAPTTVPVVTISTVAPAVPVVLGTVAPTSVPSYPGLVLPTTTPYAATVAPTTQPLTGRGSVYGCHCNLTDAALKDSLDKVQYALDSYLIDALAKSVLDGYDHDLLTVIACGLGGVSNVNIKALSISENEATDLCRQCEISSQRSPPVTSAGSPGRRTRNIIPNTTNGGNVPSTPTRNGDYTPNVNSYLPPSVASGYPSIPNAAPLMSNGYPTSSNGYPSVLSGSSGYNSNRDALLTSTMNSYPSTMSSYPSTKTGNGIYPNRDVPSTPSSMTNPHPTGSGSGIYPNRDMTSPSNINNVPSTDAGNGLYPNHEVNSMMQTVGNSPSAAGPGTDLYPNRDASSLINNPSATKSGIYPNRDAKMNNLPSSAGNSNGYSSNSREASATKQISAVSRTRSQGFSIMA